MSQPSPSGRPTDEAILGSFLGRVAPVAVPPGYRAGLTLVAVLMVLLPLVYVALIAAAGWGVYWHATENLSLLTRVRPAKVAALAYGGPLFAGVVMVFFMVKPLFAPRGAQPPVRSLRREEEPLLFAFVERVAAAVGAPAPRRIDVDCQVNASASFARGLRSMAGNDLALTIGLPLVTGLSLPQLAGVLAHELGHFAQGAGMRLSYLIRTINWWFVRVVYERDRWDEQLAAARQGSRHVFVHAVVGLAQIAVWLTRRILFGLMWIGHVASCFLLRQMEYDADRHQARLVGGEVFNATIYELGRLSLAQRAALDDVGACWRDGRLPADLPGLVALNRHDLEPKMIEAVDDRVRSHHTGRFDTHPADAERIANAARERDAPVFASELPAAALFRDLPAVARDSSIDFYRSLVGEQVDTAKLQGHDELVDRRRAEKEERERVARYFLSMANPLRRLPLPEEVTPALDAGAAAAELRASRDALAARGRELAAAWKVYDDADTALLLCAQAKALLALGFRPDRERYGVGSEEELRQQESEMRRRMEEQEALLAEGERLCTSRLRLALGFLAGSDEPWAIEATREVPALLAVARAVGDQVAPLLALRDQRAALAAMAGQAGDSQDEVVHRTLGEGFRRLFGQQQRLREELSRVDYPFDHASGGLSLAAYAIPMATEGDVGASFEAAGVAINNLYAVYFRALGRLATIAEQVETAAGIEPVPVRVVAGT